MKKFLAIICAAILISGCGGEDKPAPKPAQNKIDLSKAKDGTYAVESSLDEKLGKSILTLTIKDKKIIDADFS